MEKVEKIQKQKKKKQKKNGKIQKQNKTKKIFNRHKEPISIKNIDINKVIVSNKVPFGKKNLNILFATKILEKLGLYVYFSQKWVHIEKTLMKLNIYLF